MRARDYFNTGTERPFVYVPRLVYLFLLVFLVGQVVLNHRLPDQRVEAQKLPDVPGSNVLDLAALGDRIALSKYLMLWLQAFDNQPGISIPFRHLDYQRLRQWLDRILALDPRSDYPLLSASRVYAEVADAERKRIMLAFVSDKFREDPEKRWPWMAHAVYVAKHQLKDLDLALELATEIRELVPPGMAPSWARQMEIFILEDMDEIEAAMVLIGGLLESGEITDENELRFLKSRLEELEQKRKSG
ncbi:MAG: hypothetical protein R3318_00375 [Gammaproteobacteria bacterium]|nr:hypothetical protein [Gammaproteobacteria bacterium]